MDIYLVARGLNVGGTPSSNP